MVLLILYLLGLALKWICAVAKEDRETYGVPQFETGPCRVLNPKILFRLQKLHPVFLCHFLERKIKTDRAVFRSEVVRLEPCLPQFSNLGTFPRTPRKQCLRKIR